LSVGQKPRKCPLPSIGRSDERDEEKQPIIPYYEVTGEQLTTLSLRLALRRNTDITGQDR